MEMEMGNLSESALAVFVPAGMFRVNSEIRLDHNEFVSMDVPRPTNDIRQYTGMGTFFVYPR